MSRSEPALPLGRPESERLEFKGRAALERPERIAREVVAMLNADGGDLWIGLAEEEGVARRLEPIADAERATDRLWDVLVDRVEPPPTDPDVTISVVPIGDDRVILVRVHGDRPNRPYALLDREGRRFLLRVGRRIRSMTRDEIAAHFRPPPTAPAADALAMRKAEAIERGAGILWLGLDLGAEIEIHEREARLGALLRDPTLSGNRVSGWTVMSSYTEEPVREGRIVQVARGARLGVDEWSKWRLELHQDGWLEFVAPLESLVHSPEANEVYPYALLEYVTSFVRLASTILREVDPRPERSARLDLLFLGLDGWTLRPYSPHAIHHREPYAAKPPFEHETLDLPRPITFSPNELRSAPDACAWQVVRAVYRQFGYEEEHIPREFDRDSKRLRIGD